QCSLPRLSGYFISWSRSIGRTAIFLRLLLLSPPGLYSHPAQSDSFCSLARCLGNPTLPALRTKERIGSGLKYPTAILTDLFGHLSAPPVHSLQTAYIQLALVFFPNAIHRMDNLCKKLAGLCKLQYSLVQRHI